MHHLARGSEGQEPRSRLVIAFARDQVPNTASRILNVALPTGDQMNVAVEDGLPSGGSCIHTDVEPFNRCVFLDDERLQVTQEQSAGCDLGVGHVEEVDRMPLGNDERVEGSDWEAIPNCISEVVLCNHPLARD